MIHVHLLLNLGRHLTEEIVYYVISGLEFISSNAISLALPIISEVISTCLFALNSESFCWSWADQAFQTNHDLVARVEFMVLSFLPTFFSCELIAHI